MAMWAARYWAGRYWASRYWASPAGAGAVLEGAATLTITASGYLTTFPLVPIWPVTLPADFLVEGFSESAPETWVRTEMEVGVKKARNRSRAGVSPIAGTLSMTKVQIQVLDDFFVTTLASGVLRFDWVDPRTQAPRAFRFTAVPVYEPIEPQVWRARVELEIVP